MNANKILGLAFLFSLPAAAALPAVPVLSVCEVLDNRLAYNGKVVIVVGRVVRTMEGEWLDQECGHKLVIDGYDWEYDVSLSYSLGQPPRPPSPIPRGFQWNTSRILAKLKDVQKTTGLRANPQINAPEKWAAVFGRLDTLETFPIYHGYPERRSGFGHLGGAPAS
jgi:hypothetical protein